MRLILGLIKGIVIGGLVGLGAYQLGWDGGFNWLTYGVIGLLIGLFVGRPIWSHLKDENSTIATPIVRGVIGYGICVGLYAIVAKAWGGFDITFNDEVRNLYNWQPLLGGIIGGIYGAFVEWDDTPPSDGKAS